MTSHDWEIVAVVVFISVVAGIFLGLWIYYRVRLAITSIAIIALVFFSTLGWRFGGPGRWPWQDAAAQNAFVFGALLSVIAVPMIGAALLSRCCVKRRKSSNQSLEPTAGRRDAQM